MNLYNMIIGYEPSWEKSADSHWEKTVFDLKTLYHEPFDTNPAYRYLQIHSGQNCFGFEMVLIEPLDMYSMYNCTCTYYRFPVVQTVFILKTEPEQSITNRNPQMMHSGPNCPA